MYILSFLRRFPPGYGDGCPDPLTLFNTNQDGDVLDVYNARTTPDRYRLVDRAPWDMAFGCVAPGTFDAELGYDANNRLCFILNGGGEIPAVLPNSNNGWRCVCKSIEIHPEYMEDDPGTPQDESWPGTRGCLVIQRSHWQRMLDKYFSDGHGGYRIGEKVKVELKVLT